MLLTLLRTPRGRSELVVSLIGWLLPTRSNRPAAAAQVSLMKHATVDVKSPTSIVWNGKPVKSDRVGNKSFNKPSDALSHLYSDTGGRDDFFHSDGGSVRHGHLPVGGLLWSSTDRELSAALPPGVTERSRGQSVQTFLAQLLIEHTRHGLPY